MARFLKDRTKSQGAAPGSLIFIGKQKMTKNSIHVIQYTPEGVKESFPETVDGISNMVSNDHMTWINISGLQNTGLIAEIGKAFDISSLFLEDILNTDQRPRFSDESDHLYIIAKSFYLGKEDDVVHMEQLSFIVGSHYLITVQETDADYFKDVKKRLYDGKTRIRTYGTDYLCYTENPGNILPFPNALRSRAGPFSLQKGPGTIYIIFSTAQVTVNRAPDIPVRNTPGLSSMLQPLPSPCGLLPVQWQGRIQSAEAAVP